MKSIFNRDTFDQILTENRRKIESVVGDKFNIDYQSGFYENDKKRARYTKILSTVIKDDEPVDYLEIGSNLGVSMVNIVSVLKQYGLFRSAVSVDPYYTEGYNDATIHIDITDDTRTMALKLYKAFDIDVTQIQKSSVHGLADLANTGCKFNLINIDGRHEWIYPIFDFAFATKVCTNNGIIIFDDSGRDCTSSFLLFLIRKVDFVTSRGVHATAIRWKNEDCYYDSDTVGKQESSK